MHREDNAPECRKYAKGEIVQGFDVSVEINKHVAQAECGGRLWQKIRNTDLIPR